MSNTIKEYHGAKASLPTLAQGQFGYCIDTDEVYIGDGATNHKLAADDDIVKAFTGLSDTPSAYTDQAGKFTRVNDAEDALEFSGGASMELSSRTIYADADSGDDDTGDGSSESPYETYEKALSDVKSVIDDGVTITIHLNEATATYTPVITGRICV